MREYLESTAVFGLNGWYRYMLKRRMGHGEKVMLIVGLNPSTADARSDDPTIRRCVTFALREGCDTLLMGNLFAYRATDPYLLMTMGDTVGPENFDWLGRLAAGSDVIVAAWGAHRAIETPKGTKVRRWFLETYNPWCFGITKAGHPRHPLYLRRDTPLQRVATVGTNVPNEGTDG